METTNRRFGYARVSTNHQSIDPQVDALKAAGVHQVFSDIITGTSEKRPGLDALLSHVRPGDEVVVWRLDRLGRSLSHVVSVAGDLHARGVGLVGLNDGIDYSTPTGRMLAGILASLAEYEKVLINERAAVAREAAKARGKQTGRPAALTEDQVRQVRALKAGGETPGAIATTFGVGRATIYRALAE